MIIQVKKIVLSAGVVAMSFAPFFALAGNDKIIICHATGSDKHPFVKITVSANGLNGHENHPGDTAPNADGSCQTGVSVPTIAFTLDPSAIFSGGSATLSWSSTGTTSCSGASTSGDWTGTQTLSGSVLVSPTEDTVYTLSCVGPGGTASTSLSLAVFSPS